jgi:broad specificity phosphatase PhoE
MIWIINPVMTTGGGQQPPPGSSQVSMLRRLLFTLLLCLGLEAQDSVFILLRHAEKTHRGDSAGLSSRGHRRANHLPVDLAPFQPVALIASNLPRTQQTLEPLSKCLGLPIQIHERGTEWTLGQSLQVRYLGKTVVVCGHSDTLRTWVKSLGHRTPFPEVTGFDRFWVLRVSEPGGVVTLEEHLQTPVPLPVGGGRQMRTQ